MRYTLDWVGITRPTGKTLVRVGEKMQLQKPRTCTSEGRRGHSAQGCASTRSDTESERAVFSCVWRGVGWGPWNLDDFNKSGQWCRKLQPGWNTLKRKQNLENCDSTNRSFWGSNEQRAETGDIGGEGKVTLVSFL